MDQIADLITRIKNASLVKKYEVTMPYSKMKEAILDILKDEGFIKDISVSQLKANKILKITISETKTPSHLRQISKPGHRIYLKSKEIKLPLRGLGLAIVSTSKGVINAQKATKQGIGGEVICEIW